MPRIDRLSKFATTWETERNRGSVTYHSTRVVAWENDIITLNTGGWRSVTTKRKMNQASNQFALGYSVYQKNGDWFVYLRQSGLIIPYDENKITFSRYAQTLEKIQ